MWGRSNRVRDGRATSCSQYLESSHWPAHNKPCDWGVVWNGQLDMLVARWETTHNRITRSYGPSLGCDYRPIMCLTSGTYWFHTLSFLLVGWKPNFLSLVWQSRYGTCPTTSAHQLSTLIKPSILVSRIFLTSLMSKDNHFVFELKTEIIKVTNVRIVYRDPHTTPHDNCKRAVWGMLAM